MITEEINYIEFKKEGIKQIWKLMGVGNISLPYGYFLEELGDSLKIVKGKVFKGVIAELFYDGYAGIIEISFTDEKDLEELRACFKDSEIKFKLSVA